MKNEELYTNYVFRLGQPFASKLLELENELKIHDYTNKQEN